MLARHAESTTGSIETALNGNTVVARTHNDVLDEDLQHKVTAGFAQRIRRGHIRAGVRVDAVGVGSPRGGSDEQVANNDVATRVGVHVPESRVLEMQAVGDEVRLG